MIFYGLFSTSLRDQSSGVLKDALCKLLKNFSRAEISPFYNLNRLNFLNGLNSFKSSKRSD